MNQNKSLGLRRASCALFAVLVAVSAGAQETTSPTLDYVMTYRANLAPPQAVAADRFIYEGTGGWVTMANGTKGSLRAPCADWLEQLESGASRLDVRCTIEMEDGALIYMEYTGRIVFSPEGQEKAERGESLSGSDAYFIASPTFHTTSEQYAWMNQAVFVNKWVKTGEGASYVVYDTYKVVP
ncbi:MAG: DUF3237 domain-containing protein [Pseudomonadota bacterium]